MVRAISSTRGARHDAGTRSARIDCRRKPRPNGAEPGPSDGIRRGARPRTSSTVRGGLLTTLAAIAALLWAADAGAYEQRSNTVSLGIQGGFGLMSGSGDYEPDVIGSPPPVPYDAFDLGPGLAIHVRYSLDRKRAIGFTFEDLRFDRKSGSTAEPTQYQLNNFLAQYYVYFNRRAKTSFYGVGGLGFHRGTFRLRGGSSIQPGEGLSSNLGAGLEYFLRRPFSIDGSIRGYWLKPKQGTVVGGEAFLGIHYYLTR